MIKIATWNVNSLRVRLPHLLDWLATDQPDLLGLQETKLVDDKFPREEIEAAGYHVVYTGQPTYNGVALLARAQAFGPAQDLVLQDPRLPDDQKRLIAATWAPLDGSPAIRLICGYIPNGSEVGSEKYAYKLRWLEALEHRLQDELAQHSRLALVGDFNIAPADPDVYDPAAWHEKILCSTPEREAYQRLLGLGLHDALREHLGPDEKAYTWWDYRQGGYRRNLGLRIDHLLLSQALQQSLKAVGVDHEPRRREQPSDHAPVWVQLASPG